MQDIYSPKNVSNNSQSMQRIVRSDGVECTRCRAVMVAFDMAAQSSVEVPETWREALRSGDGPEPEDKA